ncbi:MAG: alanyl-tRNA editing protein [Pyramidobacter sp.]|nr:alanyl-tRNA editing protein [Pyramidobacter sp.]
MKCRIESVRELKGKKAQLCIEPNPFHVSGGGQPGDSGMLAGQDFAAEVTDCRKSDAGAVLDVKLSRGLPAEGMEIEAVVDTARNAVLSRMHSGEHVLSKVMENARDDVHIYKVAVGEKQTSVFFHASAPVDWDFLFESEKRANEIVSQGLDVSVRILPVEEAKKLTQLKANWGRIADSEIRIVEIDGFDCIACSGSHVSCTSEIGEIFIESFKGGPADWEVTFSLGAKSSKDEYSKIMRRLLHKVHCKPSELERSLERLSAENKELSKTLSKIRSYLVLPFDEVTAGSLSVSLFALTGIPRDMATASLSARCEETPCGVVLGLFDDGESAQIPFVVMSGAQCSLPLKDMLKDARLQARGGGNSGMISGVTSCRSAGVWLSAIEELSARG